MPSSSRLVARTARSIVAVVVMLTSACASHTMSQPGAGAALPLEGPIWTVIELGGQPVSATRDGRLPHIHLVAEQHQLQGFGGCNRLTGSYETHGDALRFPAIAMTRMACADTMQLEQAFVTTLEATDTFRIADGTLELIAGGKPRARLRVVAP